jgi:hypothetical protein
MNAINKSAIFAVFNDADTSSASFADRLFQLGVGDRATAKPLAMEWAATKYKATIEQGQRGDKLPRNSAAERAMFRVLDVCFPKADMPATPKESSQSDPVTKLLKAYAKLTPAEKRKFLNRI